MSFKYQAPVTYKSTVIVIAGQSHEVKNGVVESKEDIYPILAPLGFVRVVTETKVDTKKETAVVKS
jgi:hypothetical protein